MSATSFFAEVAPDARVASSRTGVPVSVILAQWGVETGYGTSAAWRDGSNFAGVSSGGHPIRYGDRAAGLAAYINTMLSPRYDAVRAAGNPTAAARALGVSQWDAGHYGGDGSTLLGVLERYKLASFDVAGTSPAAELAGFTVPGTSLHVPWPWEIPGAITKGLAQSTLEPIRKMALWGIVVAGGMGLAVAGVWTVTRPARKKVSDTAVRAAEAYATGGASEATKAAAT